MKKIGLFANKDIDPGFKTSISLIQFLSERNCRICLCGDTAELSGVFAHASPSPVSETDFLVVLGGDGTFLKAAGAAALGNTPMLGINLGKLGYLTDTEASGAREALEKLLSGNYRLERRMMLNAGVEGGKPETALNEALVARCGLPRPIELKVDINGEHMDTYRADGVIVSTPTGSTAYNLSAGGPVLKPDAEMLAITPVCPHALHVRSAVVSSADVVNVTLVSGRGGELYTDGVPSGRLLPGDTVSIKRSEHYVTVVRTNDLGFYDVLRKKLMWS